MSVNVERFPSQPLTTQTPTQPLTSDARHELSVGEPIVRLTNVYKSFGSLKVLDGVSIDFEKGKNTVIVGPSGTGKSVLLKHIVGLLRPDKGEVYFDKQRIDQLDEPELVAVRKRIGFLFQMGALFDSMSVGDNVEFPLVEHAKMSLSQRHERRDTVLKMVGLPGIAKKMPAELSGGQRKRVALARAVVLNPDVVLYDEPTTGLDPIRSDVINELIVQLNRKLGITSIIVTHDMISARKIAHRIVMLYDGHIVADQPPEQFLSSQDDLVKRFVQGIADKEDLQSIQDGFD